MLLREIVLYISILNLNLPKIVENFYEWTKLNLNWNFKSQIDKTETTKSKITLYPNY